MIFFTIYEKITNKKPLNSASIKGLQDGVNEVNAMPIVSVDLKFGQEIKIKNKQKINPFMAVGRFMNEKGFDFVGVMSKLTPVAHKVFWEMVKLRDETTNVVLIDSSLNTSSQNAIISKGYRLLQEKELLIKIGKGMYMINPYAILPTFDKCNEVNLEWDKYNAKKTTKKGE